MKLVFQVTASQRLIFVEAAVEQMLAHAQRRWWQSEAGGVLLGRHLLDSNDLVVDEVTTPQEQDRLSRFSFFRSRQHGVLAKKRWDATHSTMAYLGLWHTHPQADPTPSSIDRHDWEQAVAKDSFEGSRLFFPIVGTKRIRVWTKTRRGHIQELPERGGGSV